MGVNHFTQLLDIYSVSREKPNRKTPYKKIEFGNMDIRYRNFKEGAYKPKNTLKD